MIRRIQIDNFKSLVGFSLPAVPYTLARFTCIVGKNGCGKTTVLQAFDFLAQLVNGTTADWLRDRHWEATELLSKLYTKRENAITFVAEVQVGSSPVLEWTCKYSPRFSYMVEEWIKEGDTLILGVQDGKLLFWQSENLGRREVPGLKFPGSALSVLDEDLLYAPLRLLKKELGRWPINFELFSTFNLKQDSVQSGRIGPKGENFGGYWFCLRQEARDRIQAKMLELFPDSTSIFGFFADSHPLKPASSDRVRLAFLDRYIRHDQHPEGIPSQHFSDGFIRVLAIVTQIEGAESPDTVLLLDEIEDGIHPELMAKLVNYLVESNVQVIATTHSPLILNYLTDEQARESAIFLYRNSEGKSRSCRYFDLPSTRKKLGILGPGEVYVDTSIEQLALEAEEMERGAVTGAGAQGQ